MFVSEYVTAIVITTTAVAAATVTTQKSVRSTDDLILWLLENKPKRDKISALDSVGQRTKNGTR